MISNETNEVQNETNIKDKITALKNLSKSLEFKLLGYMYNTSSDRWVIRSKALAGSDFINKVVGMVNTFTENANLITTKRTEGFFMQYADFFRRLNNLLLNDESVPADNYRSIVKMCKDTMVNIGDIITGSREFISKSMGDSLREEEKAGVYE